MAHNTIENQERAVPTDPLEQQIIQLESRILELEAHLDAIRRGKVMRILRKVDRLLGKE